MRTIWILPLLLAVSACQSTGTDEAALTPMDARALSETHAFAQAACGSCHGVERYGLSPNPGAPEFAVIANREGLTRETLRKWLVTAHNYPEQMDFYLEADEVDDIVGYMLTLREEGYQLPPS